MSRWYGKIGFSTQIEKDPINHPSVYSDQIVIKNYYGDLNAYMRRWRNGSGMNDDITITAELSVLMDSFLMQHLGDAKYIEWMNSKWKVVSVTPAFPRVTISIGEIYNG